MSEMGESKIGSHVRLYLYRLPRKNHDAMVHLGNQFADIFRNYGCYARSFKLESTEISKEFTDVANILPYNQSEEIWIDLEFTEDRKHRDEVDSKIQNDESAGLLMIQFLELIVQGARPIKNDFVHSRA
jgi:Protein of unknown function (DUF1428)